MTRRAASTSRDAGRRPRLLTAPRRTRASASFNMGNRIWVARSPGASPSTAAADWRTSQLPSRFVDELPMANVEAGSETGYYGGGPGMQETARSRWDDQPEFGSTYSSPGWRRAQNRGFTPNDARTVIEGEGRLVATSDPSSAGAFSRGDRVFHQKFGAGKVTAIEGNKLTVAFDHAGEKKVIDTFVQPA